MYVPPLTPKIALLTGLRQGSRIADPKDFRLMGRSNPNFLAGLGTILSRDKGKAFFSQTWEKKAFHDFAVLVPYLIPWVVPGYPNFRNASGWPS
jgi:hypothetical protein